MRAPGTNPHQVRPYPIDGMDKSTPATIRATCLDQRDQFEPERCRAQKAKNSVFLAQHMAQILGENTPMDSSNSSTRTAITLPELAAAIGANPRTLRNAFYLRPADFPPAIYLPGCRGPRVLVSDVQAWLESRKTPAAPPPPVTPKPQGRPRKASPAQIARARQGKGGAA